MINIIKSNQPDQDPVDEPSEPATLTPHETDIENPIPTEVEDEHETTDEKPKKKVSRIPYTNFQQFRMPHTIVLLNLGLLITKSNFLLTDLLRFLFGLSFFFLISKHSRGFYKKICESRQAFVFKCQQGLAENHGFLLYRRLGHVQLAGSHLGSLFAILLACLSETFHLKGLPEASYLRYLTGKMGQYLQLATIDLVDIRHVCARFIHDMNLPCRSLTEPLSSQITPKNQKNFQDELIGLVNGLVECLGDRRMKMPSKCNFKRAQNLNMEACALSYILIVITTLFLYNQQPDVKVEPSDGNGSRKFSFNQWFEHMQNVLARIKDFAFGM